MSSLLKSLLSLPDKLANSLTFLLRNVNYEESPIVLGRLSIRGKGRLVFGKGVRLNSSPVVNPVGLAERTSFFIGPNGSIVIGNKVGISSSLLYAREKITIEDNVLIGGGCQIFDTDFHSISYEDRVLNGDTNVAIKPVLIKNGAFIGASCLILKGVTIGERSVIAAGSVVTKHVPANQVWGGNPAKLIRELDN